MAINDVVNTDGSLNIKRLGEYHDEIADVDAQLADIAYIVKSSGDTTGVTDRININNAISTADISNTMKKVLLIGDFIIKIPGSYGSAIQIENGITLEFAMGAKVSIVDNDYPGYQIINCFDKSNFKIINPYLIGDRALKEARSFVGGGEFGVGLQLRGSKNFIINNVNVSETWGDGVIIEINSSTMIDAENGYIDRVIANRCSRNSVAISSGKNITIDEIISSNCDRVLPGSALDIEPTFSYENLENIKIGTLISHNDPGSSGLRLNAFNNTTAPKNITITIDNVYISGDTVAKCSGFKIENSLTNKPLGYININDIIVKTALQWGLYITGIVNNGLKVNIESVDLTLDDTTIAGTGSALYFAINTQNQATQNFGECIINSLKIQGSYKYTGTVVCGLSTILPKLRMQKFLNVQSKPFNISGGLKLSDFNDDGIQLNAVTIPASPWAFFNGTLYHNEGAVGAVAIGKYNMMENGGIITIEVRSAQSIGLNSTAVVIQPASLAWVNGFKCSEVGAKIRFKVVNGVIRIIDKIGNWVSWT